MTSFGLMLLQNPVLVSVTLGYKLGTNVCVCVCHSSILCVRALEEVGGWDILVVLFCTLKYYYYEMLLR